MKKNNPFWISAVVVTFILIILNVVFSVRISESKSALEDLNWTITNMTKKIGLQGDCPDSKGGSDTAILHIKYFYTDYCPWCKRQEPILQKMVSEYGSLISIEWYNTGVCSDIAKNYSVSGVPTLIFSTTDDYKEYSHYGFTYEEDLRKLICDVTGGC